MDTDQPITNNITIIIAFVYKKNCDACSFQKSIIDFDINNLSNIIDTRVKLKLKESDNADDNIPSTIIDIYNNETRIFHRILYGINPKGAISSIILNALV